MTRIGNATNPGILKQIIIRQLTEITKILDFPQYTKSLQKKVLIFSPSLLHSLILQEKPIGMFLLGTEQLKMDVLFLLLLNVATTIMGELHLEIQ